MNAPVSKTPKRANHSRQVNIVWFVDTSRTHSFALSFRAVGLCIGVLLLVLALAIGQYFYTRHLQISIAHHQQLVRELKTNVVETLLSSHPASVAIEAPPAPSLPVETRATPLPERRAKALLPATPSAAEETGGVRFERAALVRVDDEMLAKFILTTSGREQAFTGRVCALVKGTDGKSYLASESSFKPFEGRGCPEGLLVRFSKLRPTEIPVGLERNDIQSVELRFVDRETQRVISHLLKNP